jgi:hypothetical protein
MASVDRAAINFLTGKEQTDIESTSAAGRQISGKGAETYSLAKIPLLPVFYPAAADNLDRTTN